MQPCCYGFGKNKFLYFFSTMYNIPYILIFTYVGCLNIYSIDASSNHDWDLLIFTQHWPLSVCLQWKEVLLNHTCSLPIKELWTIHGIWPTKLGTRGPAFCNSSLHFNASALSVIEPELRQYWGDVHNESAQGTQLWKHEWKKHGTCAATLPALDTELKYFKQGLTWIKEYTMDNVLSKAGIQPNNNYTPEAVSQAVHKILGKNPAIQCIEDNKNKQYYLFEIRICFDKNLTFD
ncbi:hypothetical protein L9F63_005017 [Diploptera punctata]|uniref:Uncharacterized protein n=1 Tax=Diploptera punctata TaxID=6984 RepID=A0AAD8E6N9_DIPPU|nr:hypothetical protein L9F63_005017 [Diploptera punctata]